MVSVSHSFREASIQIWGGRKGNFEKVRKLTLFWKNDAWKCDVVADIDTNVIVSSELGLCR